MKENDGKWATGKDRNASKDKPPKKEGKKNNKNIKNYNEAKVSRINATHYSKQEPGNTFDCQQHMLFDC